MDVVILVLCVSESGDAESVMCDVTKVRIKKKYKRRSRKGKPIE